MPNPTTSPLMSEDEIDYAYERVYANLSFSSDTSPDLFKQLVDAARHANMLHQRLEKLKDAAEAARDFLWMIGKPAPCHPYKQLCEAIDAVTSESDEVEKL